MVSRSSPQLLVQAVAFLADPAVHVLHRLPQAEQVFLQAHLQCLPHVRVGPQQRGVDDTARPAHRGPSGLPVSHLQGAQELLSQRLTVRQAAELSAQAAASVGHAALERGHSLPEGRDGVGARSTCLQARLLQLVVQMGGHHISLLLDGLLCRGHQAFGCLGLLAAERIGCGLDRRVRMVPAVQRLLPGALGGLAHLLAEMTCSLLRPASRLIQAACRLLRQALQQPCLQGGSCLGRLRKAHVCMLHRPLHGGGSGLRRGALRALHEPLVGLLPRHALFHDAALELEEPGVQRLVLSLSAPRLLAQPPRQLLRTLRGNLRPGLQGCKILHGTRVPSRQGRDLLQSALRACA
mmetsp:Transcript_90044/g.263238  ORF Transcript_90044/g.263238 Transcript_90044/m.263238 type:complete len:351 (-) Transcript_90044:285-1337(-)